MSRLDEIEALEKKATPGTWVLSTRNDPKHPTRHNAIKVPIPGQEYGAKTLVVAANADVRNDIFYDSWIQGKFDDLEFAAASRNAIPWLLELVRDAEELLIAAHFNNGTELEDKRRGWLRRVRE